MTRAVQLWIARHGETDWNAERRAQGHLDVALNATGREQAEDLAERLRGELAGVGPVALHASDLSRARQTAQAVARAIGCDLLRTSRDFRERQLGIVQGKTWTELRETHPAEVDAYKSGADRDAIPGIEPVAEFRARILRGVERVAAEADRVVVVCHGGVIRVLLEEALGAGKRFMIGNAALYRFWWRDGALERVVRFE